MESRLAFITQNIDRLFSQSFVTSVSVTFNKPTMRTAADIQTILTLHSILAMTLTSREQHLNFETLRWIINLKCMEFCTDQLNSFPGYPKLESMALNETAATFTNDFYTYLDEEITSCSKRLIP